MNPEPDRIGDLCAFVTANLPNIVDEARDQINEAINAAVEDSQESHGEKEAVLSLSIGVKWNLDRSTVSLTLPVNVRRRFEAMGTLDDPRQPKLPGVEGGAE